MSDIIHILFANSSQMCCAVLAPSQCQHLHSPDFLELLIPYQPTEEELEGELEQHKTDFAKASKTLSASEKSYASVHAQLDSVTPKLNEVKIRR